MFPQVLSVPYGFDLVQGELVDNAHEQKVIAFMQLWQSQGRSHASIANQLNNQNEPTKRDRLWTGMVVSKIMKRKGL